MEPRAFSEQDSFCTKLATPWSRPSSQWATARASRLCFLLVGSGFGLGSLALSGGLPLDKEGISSSYWQSSVMLGQGARSQIYAKVSRCTVYIIRGP